LRYDEEPVVDFYVEHRFFINKEAPMIHNNWNEKLNTFLANFEYTNDATGILVCGSYITGSPTSHSDLDVHIVLDDTANYRERGNKIIDGLLIEYFANPPKQIHQYFEEDIHDRSLMSQTQFATGKILLDKEGQVKALKQKAQTMIADFYTASSTPLLELDKYFLWDMQDDLQDAHKTSRPDFDFIYYTRLDMLLAKYMGSINRPYNSKTILGNITDPVVREKYLLRELPDPNISKLIAAAISAKEIAAKLNAYQQLTATIIVASGGFDINNFKLKGELQ